MNLLLEILLQRAFVGLMVIVALIARVGLAIYLRG
jgi:hypothetical protein